MNSKLENALDHLKRILPLKERQDDCSRQVRELHQQILHSFVDKGRILTREEMRQYAGNLDEAVSVLKANDMVIFSGDGSPVGAYPFTMEAREHAVRVNGHQVYAMCALDALAIAPMFGVKTQITSRCRVTGDPVRIQQSGMTVVNLHEVKDFHFGISWGAEDADSCCADTLCMEMLFLRDGEIARQWLADDPGNREVFTLQEAVEFGGRFFAPLLS